MKSSEDDNNMKVKGHRTLKMTKKQQADPTQPSTSSQSFPKDMYSEQWYHEQRRESAHILPLLRRREMGSRTHIPPYKLTKDIYTAVPLSRSSLHSEMLNRDHVISWTPDGTRLICYAFHLDAVRVYRYRGIQNSRNADDNWVLPGLFELDFEAKPHISDGSQLRMDALYFTACGRFVVVATSVAVRETDVNLDLVFQSNEDMPLSNQGNLEDLNLLCVDLVKKEIVSDKMFCMDRIPLTTGLNMSGNFLLVTSVQHQIIYILQIHPQTGVFCLCKEIGPAISDEEEVYYQLSLEKQKNIKHSYNTGLKQAIYTYLYKRAKEEGKITEFLRNMEYLNSLRIEKVYLFEHYFLMIRMLPKDLPKDNSSQSSPCFFVIMDWRDASITEIFDEFDERFLNWVQELAIPLQYPVTSSAWVGASNFFSHANWALTRGIRKGENQHCGESLRRLLNQLPFTIYQPYKISAQSPYLDPNLFQLDAKMASALVTGKTRAEVDDPRFIVARTRKVSFQLSLSVMYAIGVRQVTLMFHPQDPLVIGVDRHRSDNSIVVFQPCKERQEYEFLGEDFTPCFPSSPL